MRAYNRMEADQTDSIAVVATKEEWQQVLRSFVDEFGDLRATDAGWMLVNDLESLGVEV